MWLGPGSSLYSVHCCPQLQMARGKIQAVWDMLMKKTPLLSQLSLSSCNSGFRIFMSVHCFFFIFQILEATINIRVFPLLSDHNLLVLHWNKCFTLKGLFQNIQITKMFPVLQIHSIYNFGNPPLCSFWVNLSKVSACVKKGSQNVQSQDFFKFLRTQVRQYITIKSCIMVTKEQNYF